MVSINSNSAALFAQRNLEVSSSMSEASIGRLSSGNRIISAKDDVAGLSVGTILSTTVSTLRTAQTSTSQAQSMLQIADGGLKNIGDILQRQKSLAVQANAGSLSDNERAFLNQEFQNLSSEIDRIVSSTNFNGINLLDGTLAADFTTLATEDVTVGTESIGRLKTGQTADTAVFGSNGNGTLEIANNGTTVGNATQNKLVGSLENAAVGGSLVAAATDLAQFTVTVNDVSFVSANVDLDEVQNDIVFTAADGSGVTFTLDIADQTANITTGTLTQAEVNDIAQNIQTEIRKYDFYQDRSLESTAATDDSAITADDFNGTVLQGMSGAVIQLVGKDFSTTDGKAPSISGFSFDSLSATSFSAEVTIGGVTYSTSNVTGNEQGVTVANDGDASNEDLGGGAGVIRMVSADDENSYIDINIATALANFDLSSDSEVKGVEDALNGAFGSGSQGGAEFQVGTLSTDSISVAINNSGTSAIYKDNDGTSQTLDISTAEGAVTASEVLDNAINTITSLRADVGALQSRFEFASSNLASSIQNGEAARSDFLDVDVAAESTAFAASQVKLQASVSVLAQANQLPQNLLKLIG